METAENSVLARLRGQFPALSEAKAAVSARRIFLDVPQDGFLDILRFVFDELGFTHLCTITCLDNGSGFEFIYHTASDSGIMLNLRYTTVNGDGVIIPSVLPVYQGAAFYERELEGLLGVKVDGLPEGKQYPLPDNWPKGQYPMRKGWELPKRNF